MSILFFSQALVDADSRLDVRGWKQPVEIGFNLVIIIIPYNA